MHRRVGATARAGEGADPNDARPAEDVVRHRRRHARLPRGRGARAGGGLGQARQAIVNFGVLSRRSGLRRRRVCRSWRVSSSSLAPGAAPPLRSHARAFRHVTSGMSDAMCMCYKCMCRMWAWLFALRTFEARRHARMHSATAESASPWLSARCAPAGRCFFERPLVRAPPTTLTLIALIAARPSLISRHTPQVMPFVVSESLRKLCHDDNPLGMYWDELPGEPASAHTVTIHVADVERAAGRLHEEGLQWAPVGHGAAGRIRCT